MSTPPADPKLYHITHVSNLAQIIQVGVLWSDAKRIELGLDCEVVGMSNIKQRRLRLPAKCHAGTMVGEYVPFYFCPRSIMLFILHRGNHPELSYRDGQRPMIHLQADAMATIRWAEAHSVPWAFSDRNAGAHLASFYGRPGDLDQLDWEAISAMDWAAPPVKDAKQAELLVHESFPWTLVERIGVKDAAIAEDVDGILGDADHRPAVSIEPTWYY